MTVNGTYHKGVIDRQAVNLVNAASLDFFVLGFVSRQMSAGAGGSKGTCLDRVKMKKMR